MKGSADRVYRSRTVREVAVRDAKRLVKNKKKFEGWWTQTFFLFFYQTYSIADRV